MNFSTRVLDSLRRRGEPYYPPSVQGLSGAAAHVYVITNGPHVLQIGYGSGDRAGSCMRGSLAKRHAKAWICAIAEVAFDAANRYAVLDLDTIDESKAIEAAIHLEFDIVTNEDAATLIEGLNDAGPVQLAEVNNWLWEKVRGSARYAQLTPVEQAMAEELHDLVTYGTVRIQRTNEWQKTTRGDLLEGNTLQNAGKAYLIPVFEKLTNGYLRYRIHRPTPEAFAAVARQFRYEPRRVPFCLEFPRVEPVPEPASGHQPRRRRIRAVVANAPAPAAGNCVRLTQQTRLRFLRNEIEGLPLDTTLELRIVNREGTKSDPRPIDVLFRCSVRDFQTFFDLDRDSDWNNNGTHSWSRFPQWAEAYVVEGRLPA